MKIKKVLTGLLFGSLFFCSQAQQSDLYERAMYLDQKDTLLYRIMLPENFNESQQYPLILFLHGAGERGNDNEMQLVHGSSLFTSDENREQYPSIVVFPQCPESDFWSNAKFDRTKQGRERVQFQNGGAPTKALELVMQLMDSLTTESFVKKNQVYVAGLSMGGMGTFEILSRKPNMFAAAIPICGGGSTEAASKYSKKVALWVFHGALDEVVDPYFSIEMVTALLESGGIPRFTLYDDANHNSWDPAFKEPDLLQWLFGKTLNQE